MKKNPIIANKGPSDSQINSKPAQTIKTGGK